MDRDPHPQPWPEFAARLRSLSVHIGQAVQNTRSATEALFERVHAYTTPVREWLNEHGPVIGATLAALTKLSADSHVENWKDLDEGQWMRALELMRVGDGVPLAWTPPVHVVQALLDADDHDARNAVLLAHAEEIAKDARRLLDLATHPDLQLLRAAAVQGWDAWSTGLPIPAQTAAASVITDVLLHHGFGKLSDFRKTWEPFSNVPVEAWKLTELRTTALMCALSTAVQSEWQNPGPGFNRNRTAHALHADQFTDHNALRGLMLATAAVRELQFERSDEWVRASGFKRPRISHDPANPAATLENAAVLQTLLEKRGAPAIVQRSRQQAPPMATASPRAPVVPSGRPSTTPSPAGVPDLRADERR